MSMISRCCVFLSFLLASALMLGGCDPTPVSVPQVVEMMPQIEHVMAEKKAAEEGRGAHRYSPFVLKIDAPESAFDTISFKDVGIKLDDSQREMVYETIAQALSQELASDKVLNLSSNVSYDKAILDPNNHLACGSRHLYVDVWQSRAPDRWGYSLWSGCGDDDNFDWKEISFERTDDHMSNVAFLTRQIRTSLREATEKGCYRKTC